MLFLASLTVRADGDATDAFAQQLLDLAPLSAQVSWEALILDEVSVEAADQKIEAMLTAYLRGLQDSTGAPLYAGGEVRTISGRGCKPCLYPPPNCHTSSKGFYENSQDPLNIDGLHVVVDCKYRTVERV